MPGVSLGWGCRTMTRLVQQRTDDDCTLCCIAMATSLSYESVRASAEKARLGYKAGFGTRSVWWVMRELGFDVKAIGAPDTGAGALCRDLIWGRRAIVSLPSLNEWRGHHDLYWDGQQLHDPSTKLTYPPDALTRSVPIGVVIFDECSGGSEGACEHSTAPQVSQPFREANQ